MARRSKKRWSDLADRQRSAIGVVGVVQVGLLVAALAVTGLDELLDRLTAQGIEPEPTTGLT